MRPETTALYASLACKGTPARSPVGVARRACGDVAGDRWRSLAVLATAGSNPGSKLSATEPNSEQLKPALDG